MARFIALFFTVLLMAALVYGCSSGGGENPIVPDEGRTAVEASNGNLLGFWQVVVDTKAGTIDAIDMRNSELILNVLGFMEPPVLESMNIDFDTLLIDDVLEIIQVDVIFSHPIPDPVFMGFDVRGIVFGPDVTNADGYTVVCSPEFFDGVPFGYLDGLLGAPDSVANYSGLAGYKYFADGIGTNDDIEDFFSVEGNLDDRGVFSEAPTKHTRHYDLDWADSSQAFFVFNYAVYANYDWPVGDPVDSPDDFDITTANSAEAFACSVTELANTLWYSGGTGGGNLSLMVEVWDWQGDITTVSVQSWDGTVITESFFDVYVGTGTSKSHLYDFYALPGNPTTIGDLDLLITVTDLATFGDTWFFGLLDTGHSMYSDLLYNCFKYTTTVIECAPPVPTGITPAQMLSYPGIYDDAAITGDYFTLAGGVTDVYIDNGTEQLHATDINVIDDNNLTCDFDLLTWSMTLDGVMDVVVTTACNGVGDDLVTVVDNLLYYYDFGDGDGGISGNYVYNSSGGRWEEYNAGNNYPNNACRKFMTPAFDVPATATDVHFRMRHSWYTESYWDGIFAGWTNNGGTGMYGDPCDGNNWWKQESGTDYQYYYLRGLYYNGSGCIGCTAYSTYPTRRFWCYNTGSVGTGVWSQRHTPGSENIKGMSNCQFMVLLITDGSVQYRGHEIYELIVWYDPPT